MTGSGRGDEGFSEAERDLLVDAYYEVLVNPDEFEPGELERILHLYVQHQPRLMVSRSPISDRPLSRYIDAVDIDGPWWDYHKPARHPNKIPRTLVAFTGALELGGISPSPMDVRPGPAVPYVIPRLLAAGATAVLSSMAIGNHVGYFMCYYSAEADSIIDRFNDWASSGYTLRTTANPTPERRSMDETREPIDAGLGPWIEQGSLLWIYPGDASLTLQFSVDDCPYLGLVGTTGWQRVQHGEVSVPATQSPA